MTEASRIFRIFAGGILLSVLAGAAALPVHAAEKEQNLPALTMEELNVRGMREKPGQLFLPVPDPIYLPSAVRYDLLVEQAHKPVRPWDISRESVNIGGIYDDEYAPD